MASNLKAYITGQRPKHNVGNITGWRQPQLFINGAIVKEASGIDNYTMVEIFYEDGVAKVKQATDATTIENALLMVTPEEVLDKQFGEKLCDFFNADGEPATPAYFEVGLSFETSAVDAIETVVEGDLLVWDATKKKYAKKATPEATDVRVFRCTSKEVDERYLIDAMSVVELTVVR